MQAKAKSAVVERTKTSMKTKSAEKTKVRVVNRISAPRVPSASEERRIAKAARAPQFAYMKAPGIAHDFQVATQWKCIATMKRTRNGFAAGSEALSFRWITNWSRCSSVPMSFLRMAGWSPTEFCGIR